MVNIVTKVVSISYTKLLIPHSVMLCITIHRFIIVQFFVVHSTSKTTSTTSTSTSTTTTSTTTTVMNPCK